MDFRSGDSTTLRNALLVGFNTRSDEDAAQREALHRWLHEDIFDQQDLDDEYQRDREDAGDEGRDEGYVEGYVEGYGACQRGDPCKP